MVFCGFGAVWGVLGVLSSMYQYSKVFFIWFLLLFVVIGNFEMNFIVD